MTTLASNPVRPSFVPDWRALRRFTVDEYHKLIESGALDGKPPVELLEGWIVNQMGHNPPHDVAVKLVSAWLDRALPERVHTRVQSAITLPDLSEPLPDIAVVRGGARDYAARHPGPADILIAIEVADSSLDRDRNDKGPVYARAGIPLYWIVNLPERLVEVYANPADGKYPAAVRFAPGDAVPLAVAGQTLPPVPVSDLLP